MKNLLTNIMTSETATIAKTNILRNTVDNIIEVISITNMSPAEVNVKCKALSKYKKNHFYTTNYIVPKSYILELI